MSVAHYSYVADVCTFVDFHGVTPLIVVIGWQSSNSLDEQTRSADFSRGPGRETRRRVIGQCRAACPKLRMLPRLRSALNPLALPFLGSGPVSSSRHARRAHKRTSYE